MSENKFIAKLKGKPTPKSVVEIQNDRLVAPFKSSPMGHIADRDSSVVVAKGAQNWAVNQGQLVPVADDYIGTESNLSGTSRVSGAGLWLNATYTFPATGDETNPVSAIIAPSAKWVLTLCGDSLITQNGSVITLTMLVKIGATHLTTKQFKVRECASQFSQRLAIDFSESEQSVIKAHGGSPLTVQVLCDDEGASATIYSGMTHLTLLQRKIDADLVATDNVLLPEFIENLLEGYIIPADYFSNYEYLEQVEDGGSAFPQFTRSGDDMNFSGWLDISSIKNDLDELGDQVSGIEEKIPGDASATNQLATKADLANIDLDGYVKKSGDTMTGDLVLDGHGASGLGPVINFVGLGPNPSNGQEFITTIDTFRGFGLSVKDYVDGEARNVLNFSDGFWGYSYINDKMLNSGSTLYPWKTTYTQVLNAGNKIVGDTTSEFSGDLIVPSEGGTLARIEDLIDLRADINEADSELQTQITAQAAEIATKQDQLVAGDNIVISNNVISATGAGGGVGFDVVVVQELPATGQKGVIYLLAKDGAAPDVYDEYVWIESTQTFELIGTTQVDLTGYVKNTDYAGEGVAGVVKTSNSGGIAVSSSTGVLQIVPATEAMINSRTSGNRALTMHMLDYGVKTSITDNKIALTDEEKAAAQAWLGVESGGGGAALPDQAGNEGKVLITNGTDAEWTDMPGLIIRSL